MPVFIIAALLASLAYQYYVHEEFQDFVSRNEHHLLFKEEFIRNYMSDAIGDIFYLGNSDIPLRVMSDNSDTAAALRDLTLFAQTSGRYDQLRILDTVGQEFIRINYVDRKAVLTPLARLQNKAHRFYFKDAKKLQDGDIYISPFDLNVEFKKIEIPYKPVVRLIMRINQEQELKGYLAINLLLNNFFNKMGRIYPASDDQFMLLNNKGYWLKSPPAYQAFTFMFKEKTNISFAQKFKREWEMISEGSQKGRVKTNNGLFIYDKIAFNSLFDDIPYLSAHIIPASNENNLIILYYIPDQVLDGLLHKNRPYLILVLLLLFIVSGAFALIKTKAKINDDESRDRLKEKHTKLEQLVEQLTARNTQLRQFSQIISHNLRSPVANLNVLMDHLSSTTDENERRKITEHLSTVTAAVNSLMEDLVETVKILNTQELALERCSLSETLKKIQLILKNEIETSQALLESDFMEWDDITYPSLYFDNIILNLLSNAIKFRKKEEQLVIKMKSFYTDGYQALSVSDNGTGLNMKRHAASIFNLHKRFHRDRPGKGMGLFMIKTQVESMGGKVAAESQKGIGSKFIIYFKTIE